MKEQNLFNINAIKLKCLTRITILCRGHGKGTTSVPHTPFFVVMDGMWTMLCNMTNIVQNKGSNKGSAETAEQATLCNVLHQNKMA